jgi:hypothetical protein
MTVQNPSQSLKDLPLLHPGIPPLLLAHLVHGTIESFDDMETIQDESGLGAMVLDGSHIGLAHIAAGPPDTLFLKSAEFLVEKPIDGLPTLTVTDPYHTGTLQIVDHRSVFLTPGVGDLVDPYGPYSSDTVALANALNRAVKQIRKGGRRDTQ